MILITVSFIIVFCTVLYVIHMQSGMRWTVQLSNIHEWRKLGKCTLFSLWIAYTYTVLQHTKFAQRDLRLFCSLPFPRSRRNCKIQLWTKNPLGVQKKLELLHLPLNGTNFIWSLRSWDNSVKVKKKFNVAMGKGWGVNNVSTLESKIHTILKIRCHVRDKVLLIKSSTIKVKQLRHNILSIGTVAAEEDWGTIFRGRLSESLHRSTRPPHGHDNEQTPPSGSSLTASPTRKTVV